MRDFDLQNRQICTNLASNFTKAIFCPKWSQIWLNTKIWNGTIEKFKNGKPKTQKFKIKKNMCYENKIFKDYFKI